MRERRRGDGMSPGEGSSGGDCIVASPCDKIAPPTHAHAIGRMPSRARWAVPGTRRSASWCGQTAFYRSGFPALGFATVQSSPRSAATVAAIWLCVTVPDVISPSAGVSGPSMAIQMFSAPATSWP